VPTIVTTIQTMNMEAVNTKPYKKIDERCLLCFKNTYQGLFDKFNLTTVQRLTFMVFFEQSVLSHNISKPVELQQILNQKFCEIIMIKDPYEKEKIKSNKQALKLLKKWEPIVTASENPFDLALRLSIAGNIMDYGANNKFNISDTIHEVIHAPFAINHAELLKNEIIKAQSILYIGDNAGEIVFDKLFIKTCLKNKKVFYAVRGCPVLNDATKDDADIIKMEEVAEVISNGNGAPSTLLNKCCYDFKKIYNEADLIISKGQGNLEGLITEKNPKIFFLLMIKCNVISELLGVEKGRFVVVKQKGY